MALLLALTLGMCLSSSAMATRVCTLTLDTCCEDITAPHCESDCCGAETHGCCLVVLSDEAAMLAPPGIQPVDLVVVELDFSEVLLRHPVLLYEQVFDIPDPPPLSIRERLARFDIRLI